MIIILGYSLITAVLWLLCKKKYFKNNIKIIIPLKHGWTKNNFKTTVTNCGFKENCKTTVTNGGFIHLQKIYVDAYVDAKRLIWQIFWDGYYSYHFFLPMDYFGLKLYIRHIDWHTWLDGSPSRKTTTYIRHIDKHTWLDPLNVLKTGQNRDDSVQLRI